MRVSKMYLGCLSQKLLRNIKLYFLNIPKVLQNNVFFIIIIFYTIKTYFIIQKIKTFKNYNDKK